MRKTLTDYTSELPDNRFLLDTYTVHIWLIW